MRRSPNKRGRGSLAELIAYIKALLHYINVKLNTVVVGEKFKSGVTLSEVLKYAVYFFVSIVLIMLQTTFFTRFTPFGRTPDILIISVAVIAMLENERAGAIFGLVIGYFSVALGGAGTALLPLIYMLTGYFCGVVAADYYRRSPLLFLIFDGAACIVRFFTTALYIMLRWSSANILGSVISVAGTELLSTLLISPVPALMLLPVYKIFKRREEKKPGLQD